MSIRCIIEKILIIVCANFLCHFFNRTCYTCIRSKLKQVTDITGPASEICSVLISSMICHIHGAKHMCEIYFIAIWQGKVVKFTKQSRTACVCRILFSNKSSKCRIFRTTECCPCAGCILIHTAADIIYYKCRCILIRMFFGICISISLKCCQ